MTSWLIARIGWRPNLAVALALLKVRDQPPVAADFIAKADALRRAGPDDPAWVHRAEASN